MAATDDGQLGQQESLNDEQDQSRKATVVSSVSEAQARWAKESPHRPIPRRDSHLNTVGLRTLGMGPFQFRPCYRTLTRIGNIISGRPDES